MNLQYISDNRGDTKAVIIPINEWKSIAQKLNIFETHNEPTKEQILSGIQDAIHEMKLIRAGKKKQKTLKEFLDGL
ncbi:MAG: hypothetical protein HY738_15705 [Bacteroidia bacterium]|nr:hypothetical protein [Bacteroidia bacterium]